MEAWELFNILPMKQEVALALTIIFDKDFDKEFDDGMITMVDYFFTLKHLNSIMQKLYPSKSKLN